MQAELKYKPQVFGIGAFLIGLSAGWGVIIPVFSALLHNAFRYRYVEVTICMMLYVGGSLLACTLFERAHGKPAVRGQADFGAWVLYGLMCASWPIVPVVILVGLCITGAGLILAH